MPYDHHLLSDLARTSWLLLYPHDLVGIFGGIIFNHINWKQVIYSTSSALSVAPSVCNTALACYVFLIFCSKLGFNKHLKEAEPIFWGTFFFFFFYYVQSGQVAHFLVAKKATLLNFSLNLPIRFFWNCTWWQAVKVGLL